MKKPQDENILHRAAIEKLKLGLVASYDIGPGNGEGLFWFQRFINLSLTYLDTFVSDIAIFVLKRDVKLQLTN